MTASELEQMRNMDPSSVDKDTLVDIQTIEIDMEGSREERVADFLRQIKNPYLFKCGDIVVQSVFSDSGVTLTDRLEEYFRDTGM